ncbi:MAG TPA: UDP-N-acetylmuramoyl-L-alanine--D-glutamate ligase [Polyangia bacterium]|nr:UDP-N-acetylmuramoyl-L-alanine--D-glutamate ligase [Polyangia bacterium]
MDLTDRRVLVVGLGRSGTAAARLCAARGARVTVTDSRPAAELGAALAALPAGVAQALGGHPQALFTGAELIVLSPGVPDIPALAAARRAGVAVTGELELASRFIEASLVGITGTNGKSTTTTLCGAILASTSAPTFVGGNLGQPLAEAVGTPAGGLGGHCVVEASSFQLETVETFRPRVAVLLNITDDHLDRYDSIDSYAAAKARIFRAQRAGDYAVVNADDQRALRVSEGVAARRLTFSVDGVPAGAVSGPGGWVAGDALCIRLPGGEEERYPGLLPALLGKHNQANALAALLAGRLAGASPAQALRGLTAFRALAHRMELVAEVGGVAYFDDSKGTNVGAVVAALAGFPRRVVLIAGGRDKGGDYAPLATALAAVGRGAVLIGEAAERIAASLSASLPPSSSLRIERAASMEEAVAAAVRLARPGDAVVLSPACSSFDMFRDYAHRAEVFRAAVQAVVGGATGGP